MPKNESLEKGYRMTDSDEIDEFFDEESCDFPDIFEGIDEYDINNLPSFEFLSKIVKKISCLFAGRNLKEEYRDSRSLLLQHVPEKGTMCLVRQIRVYDEKYFVKDLIKNKGKNIGIYWAVFENRCDFPADEESPDDVYIIISACFDVSCIDVVKTMLAHLAWGTYNENEIRLFSGCKGRIEEVKVYDLEWQEKDFSDDDLKGMDITA